MREDGDIHEPQPNRDLVPVGSHVLHEATYDEPSCPLQSPELRALNERGDISGAQRHEWRVEMSREMSEDER